jgi:hypothetical protein
VDDALRVRGVQRIGELNGHLEQVVDLEGPAREALPQRLAFEQFHRNERLALGLADVVDGADVRMIERRRRTRFPLKPPERLVPRPCSGRP